MAEVTKEIKDRLEYLREQLNNENISTGELIELESLKEYIEPGDVQLLEAAGVPEFPEDKEGSKIAGSYYDKELSILGSSGYPISVQFRSDKGNTKWMDVNDESIPSIIGFLEGQKNRKEAKLDWKNIVKTSGVFDEPDPTPEEMKALEDMAKGVSFETEDEAGEELLDNVDVAIWWEDIGQAGGLYDEDNGLEGVDLSDDELNELAINLYEKFAKTIKSDIGVSLLPWKEGFSPNGDGISQANIDILVNAGCGVYNSDTRTLVWYPETLNKFKIKE